MKNSRRIEKLVKAATAKTPTGQANYVIDALFDDIPVVDEALHLLNEGDIATWLTKLLRYRVFR